MKDFDILNILYLAIFSVFVIHLISCWFENLPLLTVFNRKLHFLSNIHEITIIFFLQIIYS